MAATTPYKCWEGSSFSDVCLSTYGSMDYYIKLLNDNGLSPNDMPASAQVIYWDNTIVTNAALSASTSLQNQQTVYSTGIGYFTPTPLSPNIMQYNEPQPAFEYIGSVLDGGETNINVPALQIPGAVLISADVESYQRVIGTDIIQTPTGVTLTAPLEINQRLRLLYSIPKNTF